MRVTSAGLFLHTHDRQDQWKQTVSFVDDSLHERATWVMPDGAGEVIGALDRETIVFVNRAPDVELDQPTQVVLISSGRQVKTLGALPGANYEVTQRPDGTIAVLAVSMKVDDPGPNGVYIVDPKLGRIDHHRFPSQVDAWPPFAVSPDGQTMFATTERSDKTACIVGMRWSSPARP